MTARIHIELTAQTVEKALQQLIDDIDKIETSPSNPEENPDNNDPFFDERARIMATVAAVARFMQSLSGLKHEERLRPLVTLLEALTDVHEGRKSELLLSEGSPGGPIPTGVQFSRARIAAAMTLIKSAGYTKEEAAQRAVRLVSKKDAQLFKKKTLPHKQVIQWRRDFTEGRKHPDGTKHYWAIVNGAKELGLSPELAARKILKS